jgi:tetratricopeptide (TPR) repeat protein
MNEQLKKTINTGKAVGRASVLTLLQVALQAGEPRFVRELAEDWLNAYPYDLPVELFRADALLKESKADKAVKILMRLVELDPEYLEAQKLLSSVARRSKPAVAEQARAAATILQKPQVAADIQGWGQNLLRAQAGMNEGNLQKAESEVQAALLSEPPSPLPALFHLQIEQAQKLSWQAIHNLIELYREQWPDCLQFRLMDAAQSMESGQEAKAVDILHDCVTEDVSGQVARRLWGEKHRFAALWPQQLSHVVETPIPAAVAAALGWNHLSPGGQKPAVVEEKKVQDVELQPSGGGTGGDSGKKKGTGDLKTADETTLQPTGGGTGGDSGKKKGTGDLKAAAPPSQQQANQGEGTSPLQMPISVKVELPKLRRPKITRIPPKKVDPDIYMDELGVEYSSKDKARSHKTVEPETPVELEDVGTDTEDLRLRADGRRPNYVVLSSRIALEKQYESEGFTLVDAALHAVVEGTAGIANWSSSLVYVDDKDPLSQFDLQPVKANDPWAVKHLLADLDEALRKKNEMIGAVLIVGGPQIIPFHHLPNPVDDDDKDVPSDNPYASFDENYFVPSWPLGRLPNGEGGDPTALIKALNKIAASRDKKFKPVDSVGNSVERMMAFFGLWKPKRSSFGYSAEIWRRASHSVYRAIGDPKRLSISPPTSTGQLPKEASKSQQVAYFNLHGLAETAEWYGQRDPQQTDDGPDYPVALRPTDIVNHGRAPQIVYTEACFGAHIFGKTYENALALKFLDSGSKAVVGSTVTSYGSVTTPLIAADLLGQTFWKLLNEGYPAGEALRRAKIAMAQTMHRRQGYLDGEDQKTLISFVLYGDPLAQVVAGGEIPKRILRPDANSETVNAICDRSEGHDMATQDLPAETLATVKSVVAEYLPGMLESKATYSHEHTECQGHNCTLPHVHRKAMGLAPTRSLVTLSKKVPSGEFEHPQYARITMDAKGKVVKLAVSR